MYPLTSRELNICHPTINVVQMPINVAIKPIKESLQNLNGSNLTKKVQNVDIDISNAIKATHIADLRKNTFIIIILVT